MSGITMCANALFCSQRLKCKRAMARPSPRQSFQMFFPNDPDCIGFYEMPVQKKATKK